MTIRLHGRVLHSHCESKKLSSFLHPKNCIYFCHVFPPLLPTFVHKLKSPSAVNLLHQFDNSPFLASFSDHLQYPFWKCREQNYLRIQRKVVPEIYYKWLQYSMASFIFNPFSNNLYWRIASLPCPLSYLLLNEIMSLLNVPNVSVFFSLCQFRLNML